MTGSRGRGAFLALLIVLVAVVAHLPALRGFFAMDDWGFLARAAEGGSLERWPARPLTTVVSWRAEWALFGMNALPYKIVSVVLLSLCALLSALIARRLGAGRLGATLAGMVVAASPVVLVPIYWISAANELWAAMFSLIALERWIVGGRANGVVAAIALALAMLCKEGPLLLPLVLAAAWWWGPPSVRRDRTPVFASGCVLFAAAVAVAHGIYMFRFFPHDELSAYRTGGWMTVVLNLGKFGGWLVSPASFAHHRNAFLIGGGFLFWSLWAAGAVWAWRRRQGSGLLLLAVAVLSIAPVLPLQVHLYPYYLSLALPAWAISLGLLVGRIPSSSSLRPRRELSLLIGLCAGFASFGHEISEARLERGDQGRAHELVARSARARAVARILGELGLRPGQRVVVLLPTPELDLDAIEAARRRRLISKNSGFAGAIDGEHGLGMLLPPGVEGRWVSRLDAVADETLVLLDGEVPRQVGNCPDARIYYGLICVAAGEFPLALENLSLALRRAGGEARFAYSPERMPLDLSGLAERGPQFLEPLESSGRPDALAVAAWYRSLHRGVTGQSLTP